MPLFERGTVATKKAAARKFHSKPPLLVHTDVTVKCGGALKENCENERIPPYVA